MPKIKDVAEKFEEYKKCLKNRGLENLISKVEEGVKKYYELKNYSLKLQKLREKLNKLSIEYKETKKEEIIEESKKIKSEIKELEEKVKSLQDEIKKVELILPNWILSDVPIGIGDEYEKPIKYVGKPKVWKEYKENFEKMYKTEYELISYEPFHHYNLVGKYIDQEIAGKVSGSRFYYLFDELVLLDFAISLYAIEFFKNKGYSKLMITPYLLKKDIEEKITYFEAFEETIFEVEKENLILIPTSEHSILAYYENKIFDSKELPLRILAWTPCFRKEAGAHGKDTKGIFRVKQFHKVELHTILKDKDLEEVYKMMEDVQDFLISLGLPNRAVIVPSGDMDKRALLQIDVQTWFPAEGKYRETHSIATMGTWVSEKLKIRYREENKNFLVKNVYCTGVAVERLICAIVENHYNAEKKAIEIPKPLQKYVGIEEIKV
jgi:seryl-tRNA synthetase